MKIKGILVSLFFIMIFHIIACASYNPAVSAVADEEKAMEKLSDDIYKKSDDLMKKKIGIFDFTTLNGTEIEAGKRLSNKLLEYLVKRGKLIIIERTELNKIMKAQAIEQTGIVDVETAQESGKVLPIDIIINGTMSQVDNQMAIAIKVIDIKTGQILLVSSTNMPPLSDYTYKENPELIRLSKQSPEKLQEMYKTYFKLRGMTAKNQFAFLMVVLNDDEWKDIKSNKKSLDYKLGKRKMEFEKNKPEVIQGIKNLKNGLQLIKQYEPQRYKEIMKWKKAIIDRHSQS